MATLILFGVFIVFILIGVPIGFAIGAATVVAWIANTNIPLVTIVQQSVTGVDSFPLMAIPFFMLAGNLMSTGGVARRIIHFCNHLIGSITGGLSLVTTAACMFFAAISGSAVATTSGIGSFMIPEMEKEGYDRGFAASIAAAAGSIGVIIPPSIPFVIYAVTVNQSTGDLFIAGVIPGILMGIALMIACYVISRKRHYHGSGMGISFKEFRAARRAHKLAGEPLPGAANAAKLSFGEAWRQSGMTKKFKELGKAFIDAFWALLMPVIILGGIYSGVFTPTESAVIAVVYCVIISTFVYREMKWKDLYRGLFDTTIVNGVTTFMVGLSMAFATYLNMMQVPSQLAAALMDFTDSPFVMFLTLNILLLLLGTLIDNIPATIILSPLLLPVVVQYGMDPITFGVVLTMNLAIGFCTPPYGIDLFVAQAIANISMGEMMRTMLIFIGSLIVVLLLTTFVPWLTLCLL
ncbi:MAG: TRAP transporter large permease [Bacillota bacterium]|nr:TRAP transporter large permease [Bacillota bacterium]